MRKEEVYKIENEIKNDASSFEDIDIKWNGRIFCSNSIMKLMGWGGGGG